MYSAVSLESNSEMKTIFLLHSIACNSLTVGTKINKN